MKIQLRFSNFSVTLIFFLVFLAVFGIVVNKVYFNDAASGGVYHQSQWNNYIPDINRIVPDNQPISLGRIYGGVASHHIPQTIPQIVTFYNRLKATQEVKRIIVIGPDHNDAGQAPITVSSATFFTGYGELKPIDGLAEKLAKERLAHREEMPFELEHSVWSQILVISKIFPEVEVTPILVRSDATSAHAKALGKMLGTIIDENTILVASVDFSHYLSADQALPIDEISSAVIRNLDADALSLVEADSPRSMEAFIEAMKEKDARDTSDFSVLNTNDVMQNQDYTTGYVFGYWGVGKKAVNDDQDTKLVFVGDIMLSRGIGNLMIHAGDWRYPFLNVAEYLKNADLTIGNLEGPISSRGTKIGSIYSFRADPRVIEGLLYSGFDVLSLANNHMWDYGPLAFDDTLKILADNGIDYVGAGLSYEEAHTPVIREAKGMKFAFLAYTNLLPSSLGLKNSNHAVAFPDETQMVADIQKATVIADIVIVQFHWGEEYEIAHNSYQENLGRMAIDAGADLVVGHHPHVAQGIEKYNNGYIAYSLGNFVFDQNFSKDTRSGLVLTVIAKNKKIESVVSGRVEFNESFQPFQPVDSVAPKEI